MRAPSQSTPRGGRDTARAANYSKPQSADPKTRMLQLSSPAREVPTQIKAHRRDRCDGLDKRAVVYTHSLFAMAAHVTRVGAHCPMVPRRRSMRATGPAARTRMPAAFTAIGSARLKPRRNLRHNITNFDNKLAFAANKRIMIFWSWRTCCGRRRRGKSCAGGPPSQRCAHLAGAQVAAASIGAFVKLVRCFASCPSSPPTSRNAPQGLTGGTDPAQDARARHAARRHPRRQRPRRR